MSIHPSFGSGRSKIHKSVLKRLEKILHLKKDDKWEEGGSVFGLPKVKITKLKFKKEKKEAPEEAEGAIGAEGAAPATGEDTAGTEGKSAETKPAGGSAKKDKK